MKRRKTTNKYVYKKKENKVLTLHLSRESRQ